MKRKSIIITLIFACNTLVQFITQVFITRLFGASLNLDLFLIASTIPTALITVIYSTLNDAFAPKLGIHFKNKNHMSYLLSRVFSLSLISLIISILLLLFSPILTTIFYPALSGAARVFTYTAMSSMFLTIPIGIMATMFGSYWYLKGKLYTFPLAQLFGGGTQFIVIVLLYPYLGVGGLVVGFVINIFIHLLFTAPINEIINNRSSYSFIFPKELLISWIPLLVGNLFFRSDTLLIRSFGSHMPEGSVVYLNLASRMFSLSSGLITIGIQIAMFPRFIRLFHENRLQELKSSVSKAKLWTIVTTIAITLLMMLIIPVVIRLLFIGGKFQLKDAIAAISLIPYFIMPAIGWGITPVFLQPLSVVGKQLFSGKIQILGGILGWISAYISRYFFSPIISISIGLNVLLYTIAILSHIGWKKIERTL